MSDPVSEITKKDRLDVVRLGAKPYTFQELLKIAEQPWDYGTHELLTALHWSWNQMAECRKKARSILRTFTGHIGTEEKVRVRSKKIYQWPNEPLQAWQEERPNYTSPDLLRLGLYSQFATQIEDFQVPFTTNDRGATVVDVEKLQETEQVDPANETHMVPCATYDMKIIYMKRILHYEMDFMKDNELARDVLREDELTLRPRWQGEESKTTDAQAPTPGRKRRTTKQFLPGDRKIGLYLSDSPNPDTTCVIVSVAQLLTKKLDQYPPSKGFPFNDISTQKLWDGVKRLGPVLRDQPWRQGWLRYTVKDQVQDDEGVTRCRTRYWKVDEGRQLGMLLQHHPGFHAGNDKQPFRLEFIEGSCGVTVESFDALRSTTRSAK